MALTANQFRTSYPQFKKVCDSAINNRITIFNNLYKLDYGDMKDHLTGLYVAHYLFLDSKKGGASAQIITGKTVGDVSTQSTPVSSSTKAGSLAVSKYGIEFYELMSMYGAGPAIAGVDYEAQY